MLLSVVIPVMNEEENIPPLTEALEQALQSIKHEIIFVDDGSTDSTVDTINKLAGKHTRVIRFTRNFGQTPAMAAGIDAARGEFVATLDGDLQNDPSDIPAMLEKLQNEELDVVAGIRSKRQDRMFIRKLPSKIANWLIRKITKIHIKDYGCTLKVFRTSLAKQLDLHGELHRFIPVLTYIEGGRIAQVSVKHHARRHGQTKYGLGRTFKVLSDLFLMAFLIRYRQKPMHFFGSLGVAMGMAGGLIEAYLLVLKIFGEDVGHRPLFYVGILLIIMGVQFVSTGFLAELQMRSYYASSERRPYRIRETFTSGKVDG